VIYPGDKLLLQVTPPATNTPTPAPATETPNPSPSATPSLAPTATQPLTPTATVGQPATEREPLQDPLNWLWLLAIAAVGVAGYFVISARQTSKTK
jgi:hypothetical protein